jgi:hypothetical protein
MTPQPCGTEAAYRRHWRNREPACEPCLDAHAAYCRRFSGAQPRSHQPCGTPAAARRHRRNGEKPCPACRTATAADSRVRYHRTKELAR